MSRREKGMQPRHPDCHRVLPRLSACIATALLVAACQVLPERPRAATTYDLGTGERAALAHGLAPARVAVDRKSVV